MEPNKNRLAENDESDAQRKNSEEADMVIDMTAEHRNEVMQRQVLAIQRVQGAQGMVEVLKVRSSNDVMDVSEVKQRQVLTSIQTDQTIEVPRKLKPAGERTSVQERQTAQAEWQRVEHTGSPSSKPQRRAE